MKIPNKAVIRFEYNDEIKEYFFDMKELYDIIKEKQQRIDKAIESLEIEKKSQELIYNGFCACSIRHALDVLKGDDSNE